jgi:hypothetical protein
MFQAYAESSGMCVQRWKCFIPVARVRATGVEECARALAHDDTDAARVLLAAEPVVDEHYLRSGLRCALEVLAGGGDAADELPHVRRCDDLKADRAVVGVGGEVGVVVGPGDDLVSSAIAAKT